MFGAAVRKSVFERVVLFALLIILPLQLAILGGTEYFGAVTFAASFGVPQSLQYVPGIVTALSIMASFALWDRSGSTRLALGFMLLFSLLYLMVSASIHAIAGLVIGVVTLAAYNWRQLHYRRYFLGIVSLVFLLGAVYCVFQGSFGEGPHAGAGPVAIGPSSTQPASTADNQSVPQGAKQTLAAKWMDFARGMVESPRDFLIGHTSDRNYRSRLNAPNYWFDALYSFGALSILPLAALLIVLIWLTWKQRILVLSSPVVLGTAIAAGYLVLVESAFSIDLHQPNPGVVTFFILGLLLSRLRVGAKLLPERKAAGQ
jgi:hypothetical protein